MYFLIELFSGNPYDFRADFWSGGCIIYKTLCGKPPFKADSVIQLHQLLQQEAINWDIQISDDCRTFLQVCLFYLLLKNRFCLVNQITGFSSNSRGFW